MSLFGRRGVAGEDALVSDDTLEPEHVGKGRPTPKRRDAESARRRRVAPPRNSKEAKALQRERTREARARQRAALQSGDERYLPERDRGPVKRYIRDYVDSRRTIGEFLIPVFVVLFLLVYVKTSYTQFLGSIAWIIILAAMTLDSMRILHGLRKGITERFGADQVKGNSMYALMRAWQMRRLRLPKPQVRPGGHQS